MVNILVLCAGGMTSSLFVSKIVSETNKLGYNSTMEILSNKQKEELDDKAIRFYYGGASLNKVNIKAQEEFYKTVKFVFLAPQVKYAFNDISEALKTYDIPCKVIDSMAFGRMNGKWVIDTLIEYKILAV